MLEVEGVRAATETKEDEVGRAPREKTTLDAAVLETWVV